MSDLVLPGSNAFLEQARRNNWQRYLESLPIGTRTQAPRRGWDFCILTASDESQASMMRRQLDWRRQQGVLPDRTRFFVVSDPKGRRIGSGGATIRLLSALYDGDADSSDASSPDTLAEIRKHVEPSHRTLVIHSGGDSRRLPHCSAIGKLFARIPHTLPDGRASTIFDEMLINLSGIGISAPPGVLALSGDVLLVFDHLQLGFPRQGVTGVSVSAPLDLGRRHGVYVAMHEHNAVHAFLHKASAEELQRWQAVDERGHVQIDTGLVWFDAPSAQRVASLLKEPDVAATMHNGADGPGINLYGDLLFPLAVSTARDDYLDDESDGRATPVLRAAREAIWSSLRGTSLSVETLDPAVFVHFGTSAEYWHMVTSEPALTKLCGWSKRADAWLAPSHRSTLHDQYVLVNAVVDPAEPSVTSPSESNRPALVTDSCTDTLTWQGRAIVSGLQTRLPVTLTKDVILHQLPVHEGFVTRILGLDDDPKQSWQNGKATYFNRPWSVWLTSTCLEPDTLWPHLPDDERTLWNARLFPKVQDRDRSLALSLPLQDPINAPTDWREAWLSAPRLSLAESFAKADGQRILEDIRTVEDLVAVLTTADAILYERPASQAAQVLGDPKTSTRRARELAFWLETQDPTVRWRGLSVLTRATGDQKYEEGAFVSLAQLIEADVAERYQAIARSSFGPHMPDPQPSARVEAAARIDFAGGWTDTPPYSLERDSHVLNAAVTLRGKMPIVAEAAWLPEPTLVLQSRDIDREIRPRYAGDVLNHRNPADPFSLVKAALVLKGIVPEDTPPETEIEMLMRSLPGGIRLRTQTSIPRGSGLGTSSIMAGAVLAALDKLAGVHAEQAVLFDQVLCVEQMMTTGGGWQDQVGGLLGGVKLTSSPPGLPQRLCVERMPGAAVDALRARTLLIYTGQQRLAKNLLRHVMSKWMAREPEMVHILEQIGELARQMSADLKSGQVDDFGAHMAEHWMHNRLMHPGCSNEYIDDLFDFLHPFVEGAKLAGAGGGGFAIVIARRGIDFEQLDSALRRRYEGAPVSVWPADIAQNGFVVI